MTLPDLSNLPFWDPPQVRSSQADQAPVQATRSKPLRAQVDLSPSQNERVVRRYVRALPERTDASGFWRLPCVFHSGVDSNMTINRSTGVSQCFSQCQRIWSIFELVAHFEGLDCKKDFRKVRQKIDQILGKVVEAKPNLSRKVGTDQNNSAASSMQSAPRVERGTKWSGGQGKLPPEASAEDETQAPEWKYTEAGMAERIAQKADGQLVFCTDSLEFAAWDQKRWRIGIEAQHVADELITEEAKSLFENSWEEKDESARKKSQALAVACRTNRTLSAVRSRLQAQRPISAKIAEFDLKPWVLCCGNGTVDLRTGELGDHSARDRITKMVPHNFQAGARAPRFEGFLLEVFEGDRDLVDYLQRAIGYALTASQREHLFHLLLGAGRNGKGTLLRILHHVLGPYVVTLSPETFIVQRDAHKVRPELFELRGARLALSQETQEGAVLDESLIKQQTGGDVFKARKLYGDFIEVKPTHTFLLATNHLPKIQGRGRAIWSRIRILPFQANFLGSEDKDLDKTLQAEAEGILAWAVEGAVRYYEEGLEPTQRMRDLVHEYRLNEGPIERFVEDVCERGARLEVSASAIFSAYKSWVAAEDQQELSGNAFFEELRRMGFEKRILDGRKLYRGLQIRSLVGG